MRVFNNLYIKITHIHHKKTHLVFWKNQKEILSDLMGSIIPFYVFPMKVTMNQYDFIKLIISRICIMKLLSNQPSARRTRYIAPTPTENTMTSRMFIRIFLFLSKCFQMSDPM